MIFENLVSHGPAGALSSSQRMRRFPGILSLSLVLLTLLACGENAMPNKSSDPSEALMEADRAFARRTALHGADGWAESFLEDGVMYPPAGRVDGRGAILALMKPSFEPGSPRLLWEPASAVVSASSDLGYTLGRWRSVATAADGTDSTLSEGNYVSIWRKDPAGQWKVAVDIGNRDTPPGTDTP